MPRADVDSQFPTGGEPLKSPTRPWVDPLLKAQQRSRTTAREVQLVHGGVHLGAGEQDQRSP